MFSRYLWLFLFFSSAHAASEYTYTLESIDMTQITFDNQMVFQTDFLHQHILSDWTAGDTLELSHGFSSVNFLFSTQIRDGLLILVPTVQITNTTRNSEITAYLILTSPSNGLSISSIDLSNSLITLSDATTWSISPKDINLINVWNADDEVLVGSNLGFGSTTHEAILFNALEQSLVRAHQQ